MKIMTFTEVMSIALFGLVALVLIFLLAWDKHEQEAFRRKIDEAVDLDHQYSLPFDSCESCLRTQHRQGSGATYKDSPDEKPNAPREDDAP